MEVVAVEIAATVPAAGRPLSATAGRPLTAAPPTPSAILHEDQSVLIVSDSCVDRSRNAVRRKWRNRRRHGAACKR
jgi:hypothetical protein